MSRYFCCILVWLFGSALSATVAKAQATKSWKTFRSEVGYELKYPDCWEMGVDDPDEGLVGTSPTVAKHVIVSKTNTCGPSSSPNVVHGVGIVSGLGPKKTKAEALKAIEFLEANAKSMLCFKHFQLGSDNALAWVQTVEAGKLFRWQIRVYCPDWWLSVSGPDILNPDPTYIEKFKKGDLALPEPDKTIIESIRCTSSKLKN